MTRDQIIQTALIRLGNRQGEAALVTLAEAEILLVQQRLEKLPELPWFLETRTSALTATVNQAYVNLPADFIRFLSEDASELKLIDADGYYNPVEIWDYDRMLARYQSTDAGLPAVAALVGSRLYFSVPADYAYTVDFFYFAKEAALSTNISNLWTTEAPDLVIAYLGKILARYSRDPEASQLFDEDAQSAFSVLQLETIARRESGRVRRMGGAT